MLWQFLHVNFLQSKEDYETDCLPCCLPPALLAAPQLTGKAQAEGFALSDFGARGTALAGGMVARADDPSAVAWNPAGITQLPGTQIMVGMTAIQPSGTVDTVDRFGIGRSTDVDKHTWANPHAYLTHQFSDNLWGGIGIFSRFGLGNSYPTNWPGRENLKYVSPQDRFTESQPCLQDQ